MNTILLVASILLIGQNAFSVDPNDADERFEESIQNFILENDLIDFKSTLTVLSGRAADADQKLLHIPEEWDKASDFIEKYGLVPMRKLYHEYLKWNEDFDWLMKEWSEWFESDNMKNAPRDQLFDGSLDTSWYREPRRPEVEAFFVQCINKSLTRSSPVIQLPVSDLIDGSGLCKYFTSPFYDSLDYEYNNREISLRNLLFFIRIYGLEMPYDREFSKVITLSLICTHLKHYPLTEQQRAAIWSSLSTEEHLSRDTFRGASSSN